MYVSGLTTAFIRTLHVRLTQIRQLNRVGKYLKNTGYRIIGKQIEKSSLWAK